MMADGQLRRLCKCNHCSGPALNSADVLDPDNSVTDQGIPFKSRHGRGKTKHMNIQMIIAMEAGSVPLSIKNCPHIFIGSYCFES